MARVNFFRFVSCLTSAFRFKPKCNVLKRDSCQTLHNGHNDYGIDAKSTGSFARLLSYSLRLCALLRLRALPRLCALPRLRALSRSFAPLFAHSFASELMGNDMKDMI